MKHIYVGALRFGRVSVLLEDGFDAYLHGDPKVWAAKATNTREYYKI